MQVISFTSFAAVLMKGSGIVVQAVKFRGRGCRWTPATLKVSILGNILVVLNLTIYVRNVISFISAESNGEILIFRPGGGNHFWTPGFGLYFTVNLPFRKNRLFWRHCYIIHVMFVLFWSAWKEDTIAIPWYRSSIPRTFIFQAHIGCNTLFGYTCLKQIAWLD